MKCFCGTPRPNIGFWPWPKETARMSCSNVLRMLSLESKRDQVHGQSLAL